MAVLPSLSVGEAELRNVAVLVIEDKDFYVRQARFQMQAILGYPVVAALGRLTFHADSTLEVQRSLPSASTAGARLLMEELTPLVALGTPSGERLFRLDTGASSSYLTVRYWQEHQEDFQGQKPGESQMDGGNGVRIIPSYRTKVSLTVGTASLPLEDVVVFTKPHAGDTEYAWGHLGQNALVQLAAFTIDFGAKRFSITRSVRRSFAARKGVVPLT